MFGKRLWVSSAKREEQGSFCDTDSRHHYNNVDDFAAEVQIRAATSRGDEPLIVDAPAGDDSFGSDQRYNIFSTEKDNQGSDMPAKHRVGGQ